MEELKFLSDRIDQSRKLVRSILIHRTGPNPENSLADLIYPGIKNMINYRNRLITDDHLDGHIVDWEDFVPSVDSHIDVLCDDLVYHIADEMVKQKIDIE